MWRDNALWSSQRGADDRSFFAPQEGLQARIVRQHCRRPSGPIRGKRGNASGSMYVNKLALRGWLRNGISGFLEAFDVKFNRLLNQHNDAITSLSGSYTSR